MIKNNDKYKLYPPGEIKCVWLSVGVVLYKLCDRDYECDGCPYDISIKNRIASTSECTKDIIDTQYITSIVMMPEEFTIKRYQTFCCIIIS